MSSCIYPENGRSETLCQSVIDTVKSKRKYLDDWKKIHEEMFGIDGHTIPDSSGLCLSKMKDGGMVTSDNCNAARKFSRKLVKRIEEICIEEVEKEGGDPGSVLIMQQACHNHLRNVWFGAVTKSLSSYLDKILQCDLDAICFKYRVSTMMDAVLRSIDKEFSLPANYPKGHGKEFKHWMRTNHPGALLLPVQRTSGSRQDLAVEGAAAVYWNRRYYVPFLNEALKSHKDNILQNNLFTVLTSMEMIALSRVFAILHFSICMPMRFLAGNSHSIGASGYQWSALSMGKAVDALETAMIAVHDDCTKFLDEKFMNSIFSEISEDRGPLEPLVEFMEYMFGKNALLD